MKALFSEYGRIVILFIAAGALIFYLFYAGTGGFRQSIPTSRASYGSKDSHAIVKDIQDRSNPTLTFVKNKLVEGKTYNFYDKSQMGITAENADGNPLDLTIVSMKDYRDVSISKEAAKSYTVSAGYYRVKYRISETYKGVEYSTTKTCMFVVD